MAKKEKVALEILLEDAEITSLPMRKLLKSRNLLSVDLIWPRTGIARKSAAREVAFRKGKADFTSEEWAKRMSYNRMTGPDPFFLFILLCLFCHINYLNSN